MVILAIVYRNDRDFIRAVQSLSRTVLVAMLGVGGTLFRRRVVVESALSA